MVALEKAVGQGCLEKHSDCMARVIAVAAVVYENASFQTGQFVVNMAHIVFVKASCHFATL